LLVVFCGHELVGATMAGREVIQHLSANQELWENLGLLSLFRIGRQASALNNQKMA
jgi:hypothetical protein